MDIFEHSEARWPSRALQQEEEEQAEPSAAANLGEPAVTLNEGGGGGALRPQILLVAATDEACALVDHCLPGLRQVGEVAPAPGAAAGAEPGADLDVIYGGAAPASARRRAQPSGIYVWPCSGDAKGSSSDAAAAADVVVIAVRSAVAPERAAAWARAVLGAARPARALLVLGAVPAEHYRGARDAAQEALVFRLPTAAAARAWHNAPAEQQQQQHGQGEKQQQPVAPLLPSGSIAAGLPAALLAAAELASVPAELLVAVDHVLALRPDLAPPLATAAAASAAAVAVAVAGGTGAAGDAGADAARALAAALGDAARVAAARAALELRNARSRGSVSVYA